MRVDPAFLEPPPAPASKPNHVCLACNQAHAPSQCRLKSAGVEHCGLCGLAHYGVGRTCPHLRSETQVVRMLETLRHSPEDRELKILARNYVGGVKGVLVRRRKLQTAALLGQNVVDHSGVSSPVPGPGPSPGFRPSPHPEPSPVPGSRPFPGSAPRPGAGMHSGPSSIDFTNSHDHGNGGMKSVPNEPGRPPSYMNPSASLNGHGQRSG